MFKSVDIAIIGDYNFKIQSHLHANAVFRHCEDHFDHGVNTFWINTSELNGNLEDLLSKYSAIYLASGPYKDPYSVLKAIEYIRSSNMPFLTTGSTFRFVLIDLFENVLGFRAVKPDVDGQNQKLNFQNLVEQKLIYFDEGSQLHECYGRRTCFEYTGEDFQVDPDFAHALKEKEVNFSASDEHQYLQAIEYSKNDFHMATMFNALLQSTQDMPHPLFLGLIDKAIELRAQHMDLSIGHSA